MAKIWIEETTVTQALEAMRGVIEWDIVQKRVPPTGIAFSKAKAAHTALREALAAPQPDHFAGAGKVMEQPQQETALQPAGLSDAVYTVLEGFTLPHDVRKILETAFYGPASIPQPAQQEPVAKVCHDLDGHIGWNPNLRQLPDEGAALYTSPPTLSLAQRPHECSRSHPHENMNAMCELRTEIARLTNENARLKAIHQDDEINTYRMTLLCIRDGLQQGMSKSIQKLQAREINDVLGLPSFASYRTSPPAQRKPLTDEEIQECWYKTQGDVELFARAIEAAHNVKEHP